ncbi:ribosomal protein L7/L12 [Streptomyces sp. NPDC093595]|uniref:ribosomal protein L7/L12 n=1 Tax=Streptomyces sp. NPDC093595 TaxID=3366045 RepID=UPI0038091CE3
MDTALIALLIVGVALAVSGLELKLKRTDRRIARLETKVDLILDHLGIEHTDPRLGRVGELLRQGQRIEAIKAYREITGAGLKEAKDAVDAMAS